MNGLFHIMLLAIPSILVRLLSTHKNHRDLYGRNADHFASAF